MAVRRVGFLIPPLVLLQPGFTTAATINAEFHGYPANLWWPWSLAGAVIVLAAGFYGIRTSARLGTVLGLFEIGVFGVLAAFFVVHTGSHNGGHRPGHRAGRDLHRDERGLHRDVRPGLADHRGIKVFSFVAPLSPPYSYMGPGVAGWMVVGMIYLVYLYRHDPRRVVEVGLVHLDPLEEYGT